MLPRAPPAGASLRAESLGVQPMTWHRFASGVACKRLRIKVAVEWRIVADVLCVLQQVNVAALFVSARPRVHVPGATQQEVLGYALVSFKPCTLNGVNDASKRCGVTGADAMPVLTLQMAPALACTGIGARAALNWVEGARDGVVFSLVLLDALACRCVELAPCSALVRRPTQSVP